MRRLAIALAIVLGVVACAIALTYLHSGTAAPLLGHGEKETHIYIISALASEPMSLLYNVSLVTNSSITHGLLFFESSGTGKYLLLFMYGTNAYATIVLKNGTTYTVCKLFMIVQNNKTKVAKIISKQILNNPVKALLSMRLGNVTLYEIFSLQARYHMINSTITFENYNVLIHSVDYGGVLVPYKIAVKGRNEILNMTLVKFYKMFNGVVMNNLESLCTGASR